MLPSTAGFSLERLITVSAPQIRNSAAASPPPLDAHALVIAGLQAHRSGDLTNAGTFYARALVLAPNDHDALNLSGVLSFSAGRTIEAIGLIGRAIRAKPDLLDAYLNLAEAHEAAGQRGEALAACHKALARAPDFADAHARLALLVASNGDAPLALAHARVALALAPDAVEALCGRGFALRALRRFEEADTAYTRAVALAPDDLRALTGHAALLNDLDRRAEAELLYRRAFALNECDAGVLASLAALRELAGDVAGALALFERAITFDPTMVEARFAYGRCLRDTGRFDAAAEVFQKVVSDRPNYVPATLALIRMKRFGEGDRAAINTRRRLERFAADRALPLRHRIQAGFALGEVLDRGDDYDGAFARFATANAIYRQHREATGEFFDRLELTEQVTCAERSVAAAYAEETAGWGNPTDVPVFVVGLPRSGTTLVEQICASHSAVTGLGELRAVQRAARAIAAYNDGRGDVASPLGGWDVDFARGIADRHAADLAARAPGSRRAVDKTPLNLMRLGLIGALFPNARVIRCHRDPRDIAVSNHTMFFAQGNVFSTDLADCGFAIREIERLGNAWQRCSQLTILDVAYEEVVADLEGQARRIIDFLDLPWEPACLAFHRTERHVDTPSSWQVRQPIYATSVHRWQRFAKHLAPLFAELSQSDDAGLLPRSSAPLDD